MQFCLDINVLKLSPKTVNNESMNFTNIAASYVFLVLNVIEAVFQAHLLIIFPSNLRLIDCVISKTQIIKAD